MPEIRSDAPVTCHLCGHDYARHRPACGGDCDCAGFRWVGPTAEPGVRGYRSDPSPIAAT